MEDGRDEWRSRHVVQRSQGRILASEQRESLVYVGPIPLLPENSISVVMVD